MDNLPIQFVEEAKAINPRETLNTPASEIMLFGGMFADKLLKNRYFNVVVKSSDGQYFSIPFSEVTDSEIPIKHLEHAGKPLAQLVDSMTLENGIVCLFYWEGFVSRFDSQNMNFLEQEYTK
ncbi:hypothetical protein [Roseibium sp.]|uniref:hypothetical protein n=1 Tax=Roseibium sp. TaxID=1936156 RepID=UPI003A975B5E